MAVPFYNFQDLHHEEFKVEIKKRFSDIVDQNAFVEGRYNELFEKEMAEMQKAKHCLLVANGTDALEIALKVYGVSSGDRVGVPGITFYATSEAVLNCGALPVWIDVDPQTGLMCPDSLERVSRVYDLKAVIPVHIYGLPAPMGEIEKVCQKKNIKIVEDGAQAHGAFIEREGELLPIGKSQNLVTFSFYPTKNLSAFGDAGAILTDDDSLVEKIRCIRNHGRSDLDMLGRNSRCDHMQAAVLQLKLSYIEKWNEMRKAVAKKYHEVLKSYNFLTLMPERFLDQSSWHLYPVVLPSVEMRSSLMEYLRHNSIGCTPFYERAQSQEKVLSGFKEGESQISEDFAGRALCLPMHPFLDATEIEEITGRILEYKI